MKVSKVDKLVSTSYPFPPSTKWLKNTNRVFNNHQVDVSGGDGPINWWYLKWKMVVVSMIVSAFANLSPKKHDRTNHEICRCVVKKLCRR